MTSGGARSEVFMARSLEPKIARVSASRLRGPSFPVTVRPTRVDVVAARFIARNTAPAPEMIARALTWGADEKVLLVLAAACWLASRGRGKPLRRAGNHALLVTVAASLLPHGLKRLFDRPARTAEPWSGISMASHFQGNVKMPFLPATHCTWELWHRGPARCQPARAGRSARSRLGSR